MLRVCGCRSWVWNLIYIVHTRRGISTLGLYLDHSHSPQGTLSNPTRTKLVSDEIGLMRSKFLSGSIRSRKHARPTFMTRRRKWWHIRRRPKCYQKMLQAGFHALMLLPACEMRYKIIFMKSLYKIIVGWGILSSCSCKIWATCNEKDNTNSNASPLVFKMIKTFYLLFAHACFWSVSNCVRLTWSSWDSWGRIDHHTRYRSAWQLTWALD
jgi:hypothetical protein